MQTWVLILPGVLLAALLVAAVAVKRRDLPAGTVTRRRPKHTPAARQQGDPPPLLGPLVTHVSFINLDTRKDRLEIIGASMVSLRERRAQRFAAIRQTPGFMGCTRSHLGVLDRYLETRPTRGFVAIFEDDWMFVRTPETPPEVVMRLPDCRVLMLSMNARETEPTALTGVVRVRKAMCCSGYLVRHDFAQAVRDCFQKALDMKRPIDVIWFELQRQGGFYAYDPPMGIQAPSFSDITGRNVNYGV